MKRSRLRKRYGHALRTQAQVDTAIRGFMALAHRAEAKQDKAAYESPTYWKHHDVAMKWHAKASALMPGGRR
jgi:hypothetical protein